MRETAMIAVWLWSNTLGRGVSRPPRATLPLFKREGVHPHCAQTSNHKCRAESLAVDFAVYLVGRLVDTLFFQQSRKLLITNTTSHHLYLNQFLCSLLPSLIRIRLFAAFAWQSIHHYPSALKRPLLVSYQYFRTTIFSRIRLTPNHQRYTSSATYFCEDKLLRKALDTPLPAQPLVVMFLITDYASAHLRNIGGWK